VKRRPENDTYSCPDSGHYHLIHMKLFFSVSFSVLILLSGCNNTEGILDIKGKVIDEFTKVPISDRNIIIQGLLVVDDNRIQIDAGQFSTDSIGCFTYSLKKIKDVHHYNFCFAGDSSYALLTQEISLYELERNAKYLSFSLSKLVNLTITIFRKSKIPAYDTLFLSMKSDGIDCRTLYPYKIENDGLTSNSELRWIGGKVKSIIKTRVFADKRTTVRWMLYRYGKNNEIIDTITCKRSLVNEVNLIY
jgi:hypothetical protein